MLRRIAELEGLTRTLPVNTPEEARLVGELDDALRKARYAETERLRVIGESPLEIAATIDNALEVGRSGALEEVEQLLGGGL